MATRESTSCWLSNERFIKGRCRTRAQGRTARPDERPLSWNHVNPTWRPKPTLAATVGLDGDSSARPSFPRGGVPLSVGDGERTVSDVEPGYAELLAQAKAQIQAARTRAALAVNAELIGLYWRLGRLIVERMREAGWGARVIDRLSADLRAEFPATKGLSPSNLKYMQRFAEAWPDGEIGQRVVDQLPWGHNIELLAGLTEASERLWYAEAAVRHGWSRDTLGAQIRSKLHLRAGSAPSNFASTLPAPESGLVQQLIKDPYNLEFIDAVAAPSERDLERALVAQVERFLLELGQGFAFVSCQHPLSVGNDEYFVDLLFVHIPTRRYVVIELKRAGFTPEAVGKLNFYVNVVDEALRPPVRTRPSVCSCALTGTTWSCATRSLASPRLWRSRGTAWRTFRPTPRPPCQRSKHSSMPSSRRSIGSHPERDRSCRWVDSPARQDLLAAARAGRPRRAHWQEALRLEDLPRRQARRGARARPSRGPGRARDPNGAHTQLAHQHRVSARSDQIGEKV